MNRYRDARIVVLASTIHSEGGDWRSVYVLARHLEMQGESAPLINLGSKRSLRQFLAAVVFSPRLVVNGLGTALRWPVLLACLVRPNIALYLHETNYMLEQARDTKRVRFRFLQWVLRRNLLLCVSEQAETLYREHFGASRTHVVYECIGGDVEGGLFDPKKTHIVMVGSINERKGADLFSRVADLAAERHPDWQFHWVGGMATMDSIYQSDRVTWHGWQWVPKDVVSRCDLFFLSSLDDPCPLAALEAGSMGKRLVAYRETGTAEIIDGLRGCRVFETYEPDAVTAAIEEALGDGKGVGSGIQEAVKSISGVEAFVDRLDQAMQ